MLEILQCLNFHAVLQFILLLSRSDELHELQSWMLSDTWFISILQDRDFADGALVNLCRARRLTPVDS